MAEHSAGDEAVAPAFSRPLGEEDLRRARRGLALTAEAEESERKEIARQYDLIGLDALSYEARLEPFGRAGWRLSGRMRAAVRQRCVVTLEEAPAALDEPFVRLWSPDAPDALFDAEAAAGRLDFMDRDPGLAAESGWGDDAAEGAADQGGDAAEIERTPDPIDPAAVALETFTLALDPYPRAAGVDFAGANFGPPGSAPLTDEAARPFAGLESLRGRLAGDEENPAGDDDPGKQSERQGGPRGSRSKGPPPDAEKA